MNRKYFKSSIDELENLFSLNESDVNILAELRYELGFRKTKRPKDLLSRVIKQLSFLTQPVEEVVRSDAQYHTEKNSETDHVSSTEYASSTLEAEPQSEAVNEIHDIDWEGVLSEAGNSTTQQDKSIRPTEYTNLPENILDTWTAIEALTPQNYRQEKDLVTGKGAVAYFKGDALPWFQGEKTIPEHNLYYIVYLGEINLKATAEDLLAVYQDKRHEVPSVSGKAALAVVLLDMHGLPLQQDGIGVSSYGWSYARALSGNLKDLQHWGKAEQLLKEGLEKLVLREDAKGNPLPLDQATIAKAYQWVVRNCQLPDNRVQAPSFAVRLLQYFNNGQPELPLLNSFYLQDLQRAKSALTRASIGRALKQYLGIVKPEQQYDLLQNHDALQSILQPKNTPVGRWPGKGRYPLVLLQQAAVNIAHTELRTSGFFSVNGPPGTGKTTLLRDVIASVIVKRAQAMCQFDIPESAFTSKGKMRLGQAFVSLYELDDSLKGHEILVASSNNKAVENISRELPSQDAVTEQLELNYFKMISDHLLGETSDESWGLIAAVLGNASNRGDFIQKAWWGKDKNKAPGLQGYFKYIQGKLNLEKDEEGNEIIPKIITECNPPVDANDALDRWKQAKLNFEKVYQQGVKNREQAQQAYENTYALIELKKQIAEVTEAFQNTLNNIKQIQRQEDDQQQDISNLKGRVEIKQQNLTVSLSNKPGWLRRLFHRKKWQQWRAFHEELAHDVSSNLSDLDGLLLQLEETQKSLRAEAERSDQQRNMLSELDDQSRLLEAQIDSAKSVCGEKLIFESFFEKTHEQQQTFSPNFSDSAHYIRDDVFVAAMQVHKAFIDAAYVPIKQNLSAFFHCLGNGALPDDKWSLLSDIWSTGFLLSPVFSTTFASVGRMLDRLPAESIGWLLIDEAGQATPQQAVGAIMRAKRVMAVGDPLQIEPVVTTPKPLIEGISRYMQVEPYDWTAPDASVQTLADSANKYGAQIPREMSELWIGSPLLVHRRCEDPMFTISNQLAYNNKMVKATPDKFSRVTEILGHQSAWYDVQGTANDKWCFEEGDVAAEMILKLASQLGSELDIFVISPFKVVAQRMRERICQDELELQNMGITDVNEWANNNIGTVHTFQGKEAQAVILLLGAPDASQTGARGWATKPVNLLNVAVSRAKQNFYVVGNRNLWGQQGNMGIICININESKYGEKDN